MTAPFHWHFPQGNAFFKHVTIPLDIWPFERPLKKIWRNQPLGSTSSRPTRRRWQLWVTHRDSQAEMPDPIVRQSHRLKTHRVDIIDSWTGHIGWIPTLLLPYPWTWWLVFMMAASCPNIEKRMERPHLHLNGSLGSGTNASYRRNCFID